MFCTRIRSRNLRVILSWIHWIAPTEFRKWSWTINSYQHPKYIPNAEFQQNVFTLSVDHSWNMSIICWNILFRILWVHPRNRNNSFVSAPQMRQISNISYDCMDIDFGNMFLFHFTLMRFIWYRFERVMCSLKCLQILPFCCVV